MTYGSERPSVERRYVAFISYRHADNREEGRRWAEWLHHALETYDVPRDLIGTVGQRGEPVVASLYPVFRDEEELPADADLSQSIRRALESSSVLIVVCSPRACQSRFVAEEIKIFKNLGRSDRILALLIDGEPNASDDEVKRAAFGSGQECLPEPLRRGVPVKGAASTPEIDWTAHTEPIAADARPRGRAEQGYTSASAYRESLEKRGIRGTELRTQVREYAERLELARLKIIAGALGLPLGTLRNRDAVHRGRKARRAAVIFGAVAVLTLAAATVAIFQSRTARVQRRAAQEQESVARSRLSDSYLDRGLTFLAAKDRRQGCANLVAALRANPDNGLAADRLLFEMQYRDWLIPTIVVPLPPEIREESKTHEETETLQAHLSRDCTSVEVSTLDFNGQPARSFRASLSRPGWQMILDHRRPLLQDSDTQNRHNQFRMIAVAQDFQTVMPDNSPDLKRLKQVIPDLDLGSLFLSPDRKWAAVIMQDEAPAGDSPIELIDWVRGRRVVLRNVTAGEFTGLPIFDPKRPIVWLYRPRGSHVYDNDTAILEAVDLESGTQVSEERFPPVAALEGLRPRFTRGGRYLVVRHTVRNRVGEVLHIFDISPGFTRPKLSLKAAELQLPGRLGEVTDDGNRVLAISPDSVVLYDFLEREVPSGPRAEKPEQFQHPSRPDGRIEALSNDGSLKAVCDEGHFVVTEQRSGTIVSSFESEVRAGEGGRGIIHAQFSLNAKWLLVWGYSIGGGYSDTEVYDARSGRLMFARFNEAPKTTEPSWNMIRTISADGRSAVLLNGQTVLLSAARNGMPEKFADLAEAVIGAYLDERGVYHIAGARGARAILTKGQIATVLNELEPQSDWTMFAKERFQTALGRLAEEHH